MTGKPYSSFLNIKILILNVANLFYILKIKSLLYHLSPAIYKYIDIYRGGTPKKLNNSGSDIKVLHLLIGLLCRHNYMASL